MTSPKSPGRAGQPWGANPSLRPPAHQPPFPTAEVCLGSLRMVGSQLNILKDKGPGHTSAWIYLAGLSFYIGPEQSDRDTCPHRDRNPTTDWYLQVQAPSSRAVTAPSSWSPQSAALSQPTGSGEPVGGRGNRVPEGQGGGDDSVSDGQRGTHLGTELSSLWA